MLTRLFVLFMLSSLLLNGCAAYRSYNRNEECDKAIKGYGRMVRWMEMEKAAISLVDSSQKEAYAQTAENVRRRGISMVDMRILAQECRTERGTAEAVVEFDYFIMPDNRMKTVTDRQKWVYREEDKNNPDQVEGWRLTSPPPLFK